MRADRELGNIVLFCMVWWCWCDRVISELNIEMCSSSDRLWLSPWHGHRIWMYFQWEVKDVTTLVLIWSHSGPLTLHQQQYNHFYHGAKVSQNLSLGHSALSPELKVHVWDGGERDLLTWQMITAHWGPASPPGSLTTSRTTRRTAWLRRVTSLWPR